MVGKTTPRSSLHDFRYYYTTADIGLAPRLCASFLITYLDGFEGPKGDMERNTGLSDAWVSLKYCFMVKTIQLIAGIIILIGMEILRVYFIMPFPGSQRSETIGLAYFIHNYIAYFRIVGRNSLRTNASRGVDQPASEYAHHASR